MMKRLLLAVLLSCLAASASAFPPSGSPPVGVQPDPNNFPSVLPANVPSFASWAALKAYPGWSTMSGGGWASVQAYTAGTNLGGGIFYWDPNNTTADDGGTINDPTGNSGAGRWVRLYVDGTYDVTWFGALTNNTTDSTTAFQEAAATGGNVYIPAGIYHMSNSVTLSSGQWLMCAGMNKTLITREPGFNSTATAGFVMSVGTGQPPNVKDCAFGDLQPADFITTASAASSVNATTLTVAAEAPNVVGNNVYDETSGQNPSSTPGTVVSVSGTGPYTITMSAPITFAVSAGDTLAFSPSRSQFVALSAGTCGTAAGSLGCKYPPWFLLNVSGSQFENLEFEGCWDGINASLAGGGTHYTNIKEGCIDIGLNIDNALAGAYITNWDHYPYGWSTGTNYGVSSDGSTTALQAGRVDGFAVTNFGAYRGNVVLTSNAGNSEDPWNWTNITLDSGALSIAGVLQLNLGQYSLISPAASKPNLTVTGGAVFLTTGKIIATNYNANPVTVSGGSLQITNSWIDNDALGVSMVGASGNSKVSFLNDTFVSHATGAQSRAFIALTGSATIVASGNSFSQYTTGTGVQAIYVTTDSASNFVMNNFLGVEAVVGPTGTFTSGPLGTYQGSLLQQNRQVTTATDQMLVTDHNVILNAGATAVTETILGCSANNPSTASSGTVAILNYSSTYTDTISIPSGTTVNGVAGTVSLPPQGIVHLECDGSSNWHS